MFIPLQCLYSTGHGYGQPKVLLVTNNFQTLDTKIIKTFEIKQSKFGVNMNIQKLPC